MGFVGQIAGTVSGSNSKHHWSYCNVNEIEVDVTNNRHLVELVFFIISDNYSPMSSGSDGVGRLYINDAEVASQSSISYNFNTTKDFTVLTTRSWCYANADGSNIINVTCTFNTGRSGLSSAYVDGNVALTNIPRASSCSASFVQASSGNNAGTVNVAITRFSSTFTHDVIVNVLGVDYAARGVGTSGSVTIPLSGISNCESATAYVTVYTYNGGSYIGGSTTQTTITVRSDVRPSFGSITVSKATAVKLIDSVTVTINNPVASIGSPVAGAQIGKNGQFMVGDYSFTYTPSAAGTDTFEGYVRDERGRWSAMKTVQVTVHDYYVPWVSDLECYRCTANGTISNSGTYFKMKAKYGVAPITTIVSKTIKYRRKGTTTWVSAGSYGNSEALTGSLGEGKIDVGYAYEVCLEVIDKYGKTSGDGNSRTLGAQYIPLSIKDKQVAIGKQSDRDGFDVALPQSYFKKIYADEITSGGNVLLPNGSALHGQHTNGDYYALIHRRSDNKVQVGGDDASHIINTGTVCNSQGQGYINGSGTIHWGTMASDGTGPYIHWQTSNGAFGTRGWYSDERLKTNKVCIESTDSDESLKYNTPYHGIQTIMDILHYEFDMDGVHHDIGYIAQELQEINPKLVYNVKQTPTVTEVIDGEYVESPNPKYFEDDPYIRNINIEELIPNITLAIKQQQTQIELLTDQVNNLTDIISQLTGNTDLTS